MKLEKLSLANFRGFTQIDIDFERDVTVIAGVNGIGKSSLLSAIATILSHAMPEFTPSEEPPLDLSSGDIYYGKSSMTLASQLNIPKGKVYVDIAKNLPIVDQKEIKKLSEQRDNMRFALRGTAKGSKEANEIEDKIWQISLLLDPPKDVPTVNIIPDDPDMIEKEVINETRKMHNQPFAVFYSTNRYLSRLSPVLPKTKQIDLSMAYVKALDQLEISLNDFANWYRVVSEQHGKNAKFANKILTQLEKAINIFLPEMKDLKLHSVAPPRLSVRKKDDFLYLEQLSDGERGLLALVFDLTRRLAIANPDSKNPIEEGKAVVLIDEIELHLHPKWQRRVVRRLLDVFKNCQFIITTHSPQVIGQVKGEKLRLLYFDEEEKRIAMADCSQSFGMDSNWILQNIMDAPYRDYETEQKIASLYDNIDNEAYDKALMELNELRSELGDFPELQEIQALLDRFKILGEA